jgi:hypothetical protein
VPVVKLASSHAIIVMANHLGLKLHQIDIKGAYLNGILGPSEVLYMHHPLGYKPLDASTCVLCLVKMLYSLKQSDWCWYQKLMSIFSTLGFKQCKVDQAIFFKVDTTACMLTIVPMHVNNCTIAVSNQHLIKALMACMCQHIEVTDLSELHWMLGIEIQHDRHISTIHLSQYAYLDSILHHYHLDKLKPLSMPMDTQIWLTSKQIPQSAAEFAAMHDVLYSEAISALNWATLAT